MIRATAFPLASDGESGDMMAEIEAGTVGQALIALALVFAATDGSAPTLPEGTVALDVLVELDQ